MVRKQQRDSCEHIENVVPVPRRAEGCEECLAAGTPWVHLRACLECGHVGCCDQSPGRHARKHYHATGHTVIQSAEPGERWVFCFKDNVGVEAL